MSVHTLRKPSEGKKFDFGMDYLSGDIPFEYQDMIISDYKEQHIKRSYGSTNKKMEKDRKFLNASNERRKEIEMVSGCRGIKNPRLSCYANSLFQGILHCTEFENFLKDVSRLGEDVLEKILPTTSSMVKLFSQMKEENKSAISEEFVEKILARVAKKGRFTLSRQEDATELMLVLLNKLHDEEVAWKNSLNDTSSVSDIFRFKMEYWNLVGDGVVKSVSPEFSINLPIGKNSAETVQGELDNMCDYENGKTLLDELPKILIIQLNFFTCKEERTYKSPKAMRVNKILKFSSSHFSENGKTAYGSNEKKYRIRSVILHSGKSLHSGHYTANILRNGMWNHFDDTHVSKINEKEALHHDGHRVPYLLFYENIPDKGDDDRDREVKVDGKNHTVKEDKKENGKDDGKDNKVEDKMEENGGDDEIIKMMSEIEKQRLEIESWKRITERSKRMNTLTTDEFSRSPEQTGEPCHTHKGTSLATGAMSCPRKHTGEITEWTEVVNSRSHKRKNKRIALLDFN